jgi:hypothetical protein
MTYTPEKVPVCRCGNREQKSHMCVVGQRLKEGWKEVVCMDCKYAVGLIRRVRTKAGGSWLMGALIRAVYTEHTRPSQKPNWRLLRAATYDLLESR